MSFSRFALPPALANAPLRRLLAVQLPADFADYMDFVAIGALLAFTWQVEPIVYAFLALALAAPYVLAGLFAGVLVDQMPLRRVILLSNLGRAATTGALFWAGSWQVLVALLFLRGVVDSFFTPAKQAALQALTNADDRASANGLSRLIAQLSRILGPGLGGLLLLFMAPGGLFLVNAMLSLIAAMLALRLGPLPRQAGPRTQRQGMFGALTDGLRTAWALRRVRYLLMFQVVLLCATALYRNVHAPLFETLGLSAHQIGLPVSFVGLGGVVGAAIVTMRTAMTRPFLWVLAGLVPGALALASLGALALLGLAPPLWTILPLFFVAGLTSTIGFLPLAVVLQDSVPEDKMGRISALSGALNSSVMMMAPFLGTMLAELGGYGLPIFAGGLIIAVLAFVALWLDRL